jgi:L-rhamnonate dehydratase
VLQPDITWCGGVTAARRAVALAAAFDVPVVPHGSSVYSFHLQLAFPNCPIAECLIMSPEADRVVPYFGKLFTNEPLPKDGYVSLDPTRPGFGVDLNRKGLTLRRPHAHEPLTAAGRIAAAGDVPKQTEWLGRAAALG